MIAKQSPISQSRPVYEIEVQTKGQTSKFFLFLHPIDMIAWWKTPFYPQFWESEGDSLCKQNREPPWVCFLDPGGPSDQPLSIYWLYQLCASIDRTNRVKDIVPPLGL